MVIAILDDGLSVYDSPEALSLHVEALDADLIKVAIDEQGQRYRVEWIKPNQEGRLLWIFPWVANGQYRLVPDGEPDLPALRDLILGYSERLDHPRDHDRARVAELARALGMADVNSAT